MGNYGNDIQAAIITQIKAEMAAQDLKQPELAKRSGVSTSALHRYLKGERAMTLDVFVEVSAAMGISFTELVARAQRRLDGENVQ